MLDAEVPQHPQHDEVTGDSDGDGDSHRQVEIDSFAQ
jgi:hypothetical protein